MNGNSIPSYDPADIVIGRALKDWVRYPAFPRWVRAQLLLNASQSAVKASSKFVIRMIAKLVLYRGLELARFLLAEESLVFVPSRDNYYFNPPHYKPCAVQTRVRDTFLLEAGMLGTF
jgi:hypothetical protein